MYRAVDSAGNTLDFMLSAKGNAHAAERFFRKVLKAEHNQTSRVINVDKNAAYPKAFDELKADQTLTETAELRPVKYLNNQDLRKSHLNGWMLELLNQIVRKHPVLNLIDRSATLVGERFEASPNE